MIVTTTADIVADDGETSLREAIAEANATPGPDTVGFAPSLAGATIRLTLGEIAVSDRLIVDGDLDDDGVPDITISGDANGDDVLDGGLTDVAASLDGQDLLADNSRIFAVDRVSDPSLTLIGLVLTGGRTTEDNERGGAVQSDGTVTIRDSLLAGNSTAGNLADGGAIAAGSLLMANSVAEGNQTAGPNSRGGALSARETLRLDGVTLTENATESRSSPGGGATGSGTVEIIDSLLADNTTSGEISDGGAVFGLNQLLVSGSVISGNSTTGDGAGGGGIGGDIVRIDGSTVTGNSTTGENAKGGARRGGTSSPSPTA